MAASSSLLGNLHELFAAYWLDQMQRTDEDGKHVPLSAAEAAVLRAFLKDNNVQADPDDTGDVRELSKQLRAATEGTVSENELDAVMAEFMATNPGLRTHQ